MSFINMFRPPIKEIVKTPRSKFETGALLETLWSERHLLKEREKARKVVYEKTLAALEESIVFNTPLKVGMWAEFVTDKSLCATTKRVQSRCTGAVKHLEIINNKLHVGISNSGKWDDTGIVNVPIENVRFEQR
jgi:hypothetical protein